MTVKQIRAVLLVILASVIAAVAVSILIRPHAKRRDDKVELPGKGVKVITTHSKGVDYQDEETVSSKDADEWWSDEKEIMHLKGVHFTKKTAERDVSVKAKQGTYDARSNEFDVEGDVEVTTSDGYRLKASKMHHTVDKKNDHDVYVSDTPVEFSKPEISGHANKLRADLGVRVFELTKNVGFVIEHEGEEKTYVDGPQVIYNDKERHGTFVDGVVVKKGDSTMTAQRMEAWLRPEHQKGLQRMVLDGDVVIDYSKPPEQAGAAPKAPARAGDIGGGIEGRDHLEADHVEVTYQDDGKTVDRAVAEGRNGPARFMVTPADAGAGVRRLQAATITVSYTGGAPSAVVAEQLVKVTVEGSAGQPPRTITSNRVEATLAKGGGLQQATFTGDVEVLEGDRSGHGDKAVYLASNEVVTLDRVDADGSRGTKADIAEGDSILKARHIESHSKEDLLLAEGEIELTYVDKPDAAKGGQKKKGPLEGLMGKSTDPVRVLAGKMKSQQKAGTARFEDNVRMWKGESVVEAPVITVKRDGRELVAENGAQATFQHAKAAGGAGAEKPPAADKPASAATPGEVFDVPGGEDAPIVIEAQRLTMDDDKHKLLCESLGGPPVKVRQGTMLVTGKAGDFDLDPDTSQVKHGVMTGGVDVLRDNRRGTGDEVEFDMAFGRKVELRGSDKAPAKIDVTSKGSTKGEVLTFYIDEDSVSVDGGRVDTTIQLDGGASCAAAGSSGTTTGGATGSTPGGTGGGQNPAR